MPAQVISLSRETTNASPIWRKHHHAYPVGDRFTILNRGRSYGTFTKEEVSREEIVSMMAGGEELEALEEELARNAGESGTVS